MGLPLDGVAANEARYDSPHPCRTYGVARPAERLNSTALNCRSLIRMRSQVQVLAGPPPALTSTDAGQRGRARWPGRVSDQELLSGYLPRHEARSVTLGELPSVQAGGNDGSQDCRGKDSGDPDLAGCSIDVEDRGRLALKGSPESGTVGSPQRGWPNRIAP